jgi:hypothetical protein
MQLDIEKFLEEATINESFYPGKRLVHSCRQLGDFKNHSVVLDWRNPDRIRIEIKAGLTGKMLEPKVLKKYPVSFQSPTFVDIEIVNDNSDDKEDDEDSKGKSSSSGGGGKQPAKKPLVEISKIASAFSEIVESKIPSKGEITQIVVMGTEIAKEAYGNVMGALAQQISHAKVTATELMAKAGDFVPRVQPPPFMQPKGDETVSYNYDREKNADIGFKMTMS